MPLFQTANMTRADMERPDIQQIYNTLDCCLTHEILGELRNIHGVGLGASNNESPHDITYSFERALQGPVLEMMLRGWKIDENERQAGIRKLEAEILKIDNYLQRMAYAVWGKELNPRSPKQLIEFFYGHMKLPEQYKHAKGERHLSTDRETLEKLTVYFYARPIINCILALRDYGKQLSVLKTEVDSDGRMRTSYNIAGTEGGRFSSSTSPLGTGCVLPSTQALTPNGWRKISEIQNGDKIAQFDISSRKITFAPCTIFKREHIGYMHELKTEQVQLTVTPEHRVLHYVLPYNKARILPAECVAKRRNAAYPLGGKFSGGTEVVPAFVAMLMAEPTLVQAISLLD